VATAAHVFLTWIRERVNNTTDDRVTGRGSATAPRPARCILVKALGHTGMVSGGQQLSVPTA
jgi:hypothetical protein